jgi:DNA-binding Xre family transcriptional regulator
MSASIAANLVFPLMDRNIQHVRCGRRDTVILAPEELKMRRLALGLTQREVGRRAPLHFLMYSALESGTRRRVLRQTLYKIAKSLECCPEDLVASGITTVQVSSMGQENGAPNE